MAERELIAYIRDLAGGEPPSWLEVGIGDDAAVLELPGGGRIVVTTDSVVEGVHFAGGTEPALVGRKAVARALSDVAAMAARPLCLVAAAQFGPNWDDDACRAACRALHDAGAEFGAALVGGDVSSGKEATCITVTAIGTPGPAGVVTRCGAQPGDALCVTGRLGGSIRGRHLTFRPRLDEALALMEAADVHALIDVSDGLSTDALHLAEAGGRGLRIDAPAVPISADAASLAEEAGASPLEHALNDGEDYELLFCVPPAQARDLAREGVLEVAVTVIGEVLEEAESQIAMADGSRRPLVAGGWEHLNR